MRKGDSPHFPKLEFKKGQKNMEENKSNITFKRKLPDPEELKQEIPFSKAGQEIKKKKDKEIADVFEGKDNRFILIIGPCSADREKPVMEYMNSSR